MPIVRIEMLSGRSPEMKEDLIRRVSQAVAESLKISVDRVECVLYDVPREHWGQAGVPMSKK